MTFGSIGISTAGAVFTVYLFQKGVGLWKEMLYALLGIKPIVETWRVLTGVRKLHTHTFPPELMLSQARIMEILFESLPQALLQAYIFLKTGQPTTLQYVSLFGSIAAAGYILAMVARQDSAEHFPVMFALHCTAVDWILIAA